MKEAHGSGDSINYLLASFSRTFKHIRIPGAKKQLLLRTAFAKGKHKGRLVQFARQSGQLWIEYDIRALTDWTVRLIAEDTRHSIALPRSSASKILLSAGNLQAGVNYIWPVHAPAWLHCLRLQRGAHCTCFLYGGTALLNVLHSAVTFPESTRDPPCQQGRVRRLWRLCRLTRLPSFLTPNTQSAPILKRWPTFAALLFLQMLAWPKAELGPWTCDSPTSRPYPLRREASHQRRINSHSKSYVPGCFDSARTTLKAGVPPVG